MTARLTVDRRVLGGVALWAAGVLAAIAVYQLREPNGSFSYINLSLCLIATGFLAGTYLIRPSIGALMLLVLGLLLAWPLPAGWLRSLDLFAATGDTVRPVGAATFLVVALVMAIWRRPPTRNPDGTSVGASRLVNRVVLLCVVGGPVIQLVAFVAWNYYSSPFFIGLAIGLFGLLLFAGYSAFHDVIGRPRPAAILAVAYPAMLLALALLGPGWVVATPSVAEGVENRLADGRVVRASLASPLGPPAYALDGRADTAWNAATHAPAWIEIDLGEPSAISGIGLLVAQFPDGETTHQVIGISSTGSELPLADFRGYTRDGQWLRQSLTTPLVDVQSIRITTWASPSWVAWKEIEIEIVANVQ